MAVLLALALLQDADAVLKAYEAARPPDRELALFSLDWAPDFKTARERAAKEKVPIFFVATTQLEDAGNLQSGHC